MSLFSKTQTHGTFGIWTNKKFVELQAIPDPTFKNRDGGPIMHSLYWKHKQMYLETRGTVEDCARYCGARGLRRPDSCTMFSWRASLTFHDRDHPLSKRMGTCYLYKGTSNYVTIEQKHPTETYGEKWQEQVYQFS